MAFGFPAYHEDSARYRGVDRSRLARVAEDALEDLGWRPSRDGKWRLAASVPNRMYGIFMTWGAKFFVDIEEEWLHVRSEGSIAIAWVDFGQHGNNVHQFLERFEELLEREPRTD